MNLAADLATVRVLIRRASNELLRVPGAAIPGVLAPTIFFLGLSSVFGGLTELTGFDTDSYQSFILPVSLLQGAGFTGAATGVNLARDIELGWFDRLIVSPAPRPVLLAGLVLSASLRALIPATFLLCVGFAIG
ncbi:MAG: ABC transporter permease, partial [Solirubrobacterales bacterium]